jgi:hypothetical protein
MKTSMRPRKGRRVEYEVYTPGAAGNVAFKEIRKGTVLGRVEYDTRPNASAPKAYLNIKRDDTGGKERVDYFQLTRYVDREDKANE